MLQSYKIDAELLYEDYKSEFYSDMSYIKSTLVPLPDKAEEPQPQEAEEASSFDTLKIDPNDGDQRWRKTENGWEKEETSSTKDESASKPPPPPWAKKLYKKIALVSHPDRTLDKENKAKFNKIFAQSAAAMSTGEFNKLLELALDLGIEISDTDIDHIPVLSSRIEVVRKELKDIEDSFEWMWGESLGVLSIRTNIAILYFRKSGIDLNTDQLSDTIKEMEKKGESRTDH